MQTQPHWNYFCILLDDVIEFSEDRYLRISHAHPELVHDLMDDLEATIVYPDYVLLKNTKYKLIKKIFINEEPRWICVVVHFDNVHERLWISNAYASSVGIVGEVIYG
jgi:hypothetical protein